MTKPARLADVSAVLLDIEGTTTPIAFVHDVLFPYARRRLATFLRSHAGADIDEAIAQLRAEYAADASTGAILPPWRDESDRAAPVPYLEWLMDRDRKSPGLKLLQGLIWEEGYAQGELRGQVFDDVPAALRRWRDSGLTIAIYSSGSVLAQRRLFESTPAGDLTPLIAAYFDTGVGPKGKADSYRRIARALGLEPARILFISDIVAELTAAAEAGCHVLLSVRPGNRPAPPDDAFSRVEDFRGSGLFSTDRASRGSGLASQDEEA